MQFTLDFLEIFLIGLWLAAPLLLSLMTTILILGLFVGRKEQWSKFESVYYAFITATTVGYGDIRPVKTISRTLAVIIAFLGLIFTGIIVALAVNSASMAIKNSENFEQVKECLQQVLDE